MPARRLIGIDIEDVSVHIAVEGPPFASVSSASSVAMGTEIFVIYSLLIDFCTDSVRSTFEKAIAALGNGQSGSLRQRAAPL